jgi:hypothetical protein
MAVKKGDTMHQSRITDERGRTHYVDNDHARELRTAAFTYYCWQCGAYHLLGGVKWQHVAQEITLLKREGE